MIALAVGDPARAARGAAAPLDRRLDVLGVRLDRRRRRRQPVRRSAGGVPGEPGGRLSWASAWRDTTTVYGPAFTLASEPLAPVAGDSRDAAAWIFKALAAAGAARRALCSPARLARRRALALALVGWNPVLAVHLAGGGHNDALVGALVLAAWRSSAARRARRSAGAAWALAIAVKWMPLVFLALAALAGARTRAAARAGRGLVGAALVVGVVATWRYGLRLAARRSARSPGNAALETSYALPPARAARAPGRRSRSARARRSCVGLRRARARALARRAAARPRACLVLVTTPYLAVWYLAWAVPLAAADEDRRRARRPLSRSARTCCPRRSRSESSLSSSAAGAR